MSGKRINEKDYKELMDALSNQNKDYQALLNSREYSIGVFFMKAMKCIRTFKVKGIYNMVNKKVVMHKLNKNFEKKPLPYRETKEIVTDDYFLDDKIAVYTCIFGKYDKICEPVYQPNNVDYYIITDQEVDSNSKWKKIDWNKYVDDSMTKAEMNRFFKMKPNVLFGNEYKYSLYIDGNVRVISDVTPLIKRIGKLGMAFHYHRQRMCVFDEIEAALILKRAEEISAHKYEKYLKENGMPADYGLLECNVIAREHNNPFCIEIMEQWWHQFRAHFKRDQVSLPYVLYKNNIAISEVATLGNNVYENPIFRIEDHL